jgi:hypothetical protein
LIKRRAAGNYNQLQGIIEDMIKGQEKENAVITKQDQWALDIIKPHIKNNVYQDLTQKSQEKKKGKIVA